MCLRNRPVRQRELIDRPDIQRDETSAQRAALQAIWDAIGRSFAVAEFDCDGRILSVNEVFADIMGYQPHMLVGQHHSMLCAPEIYQSAHYRPFWIRLASGHFAAGRYQRRRSDGRSVWLQATYNPILDETGGITKIVKIAADVTSDVAVEQRLHRELSAAEQLQGDLQRTATIQTETIEALDILVTRIRQITANARIISLNASIEAIRLGETGRGFAAIAEAMKGLVRETSDATDLAKHVLEQSTRRLRSGSASSVE